MASRLPGLRSPSLARVELQHARRSGLLAEAPALLDLRPRSPPQTSELHALGSVPAQLRPRSARDARGRHPQPTACNEEPSHPEEEQTIRLSLLSGLGIPLERCTSRISTGAPRRTAAPFRKSDGNSGNRNHWARGRLRSPRLGSGLTADFSGESYAAPPPPRYRPGT